MRNIKSIWESQISTGNDIVRTRIDEILSLNCYAATNLITGQHIYIMSISKVVKIPELKNYRFKGVVIFSIEVEESLELNIYLLDNSLKDIFSLFVQNILEEVADIIDENEAVARTLIVVSKWKKLFDKINFGGLGIEEQKGLIGELLFFNFLLDNQISPSSIISAWTGVDYKDKDFVFGWTGLEVKMTTSKHPKITITSERQLDTQNLNDLFLILYTTEEVKENGFSLNSLVDQIRQKIYSNPDHLNIFNQGLLDLGYADNERDHYGALYSHKRTFCFTIADDFPKIVKSQLPLGVYDTSYSIELSAAENFIVEIEKIIQKI